tara:strand:+ start:85888 stop:86061 length:174 start_codon:yes stop_codon:yes gene_type:complete
MRFQPVDKGLAVDIDAPTNSQQAFPETITLRVENPPPHRGLWECRILFDQLIDCQNI